jgi:SAM-dependent methyltransferase
MLKLITIIKNIVYLDISIKKNILNKKINYFLQKNKSSNQIVLNVGSGTTKYDGVINIDVIKFDNVDIVAKNSELPFENNYADKIMSIAVLEHSAEYDKAIIEMHRVLKQDGEILVAIPFMYPFHVYQGQTADYYRFTKAGIMNAFGKYFEIIEIETNNGPLTSACHVLSVALSNLFCFNFSKLYVLLNAIFQFLFMPIRIIDIFLNKLKYSHIAAENFIFIAKKRVTALDFFDEYEIDDPYVTTNNKLNKNKGY